ncbi:MAG: preprotein translocase subunit YajC [Clostridiales bacterium]|nr:preprotein translocase subunit YajC [Clostridiales bacterium]
MNSAVAQFGFLIVFIAIMYLLLIRPQRKKEKAISEMRASVQVGDEIITIGGICAKVVKTKSDSLIIQVGADKVKFEIMRWAVSKIESSSSRHSSKKAKPDAEDDDDTEEETVELKKTLPKRMKRASADEDEQTSNGLEEEEDK